MKSLANFIRLPSTPEHSRPIPVPWQNQSATSPLDQTINVDEERQEFLDSLEEEKKRILAEAMREAEDQCEQIKKRAWEEGFASGMNQAKLNADTLLKEQMNNLAELQRTILSERKRYIVSAERQLIELALSVSNKLIANYLSASSSNVVHLVNQHLQRVEDTQEITIHVSLEDFNAIQLQREELESILPPFTPLVILPVKELSSGDVIIHTQASRYDARIDSQLAEIKNHLVKLSEENAYEYLESNTLS